MIQVFLKSHERCDYDPACCPICKADGTLNNGTEVAKLVKKQDEYVYDEILQK